MLEGLYFHLDTVLFVQTKYEQNAVSCTLITVQCKC